MPGFILNSRTGNNPEYPKCNHLGLLGVNIYLGEILYRKASFFAASFNGDGYQYFSCCRFTVAGAQNCFPGGAGNHPGC